jgi:lipopolysaccharide/colanic/teichoic acid biosynthesis glycosyltransferase
MYSKYIKRVLDLILSGIALLLLSPIICIIAVLVRIYLGSPVVFKQKRPGKGEKEFTLYKFRTMSDKKDEKGNDLPDAERITPFGNAIRRSSFDEILELINIFKGEMAIVGPRPLLTRYLQYYKPEERVRHSVRPGLTGLAQINGRNNVGWDERLGYDIEYVNNITFRGDVKIIIETIGKVLKKSDVAVGSQLLMNDLDVERAGRVYVER